MSTKSGGSFATILLALPLTAIALMGVFGVPQFAPVIASPEAEELIRRPGEARDALREEDAPPYGNTEYGNNEYGNTEFNRRDAFAVDSDSRFESSERGQVAGRDDERRGTAAWRDQPTTSSAPWADASRSGQGGNRVAHADGIEHRPPVAPATALDWRTASRKLSDMGIDRYHLERGATPDSFLFVCLVSPADSPQVTHRFEAEHSDPLNAVNNVLGQVDHWLQRRYAQQGFQGGNAMSSR